MSVYGWTAGIEPRIVEAIVLFVACIAAGQSLRMRNWKDILPYSIGWAAVAAALDAFLAARFQGWSLYSQWSVWLGYALIATLPLLSVYFRKEPTPAKTWES
jgi:CTP:molybdopterin cytidylyltransferase MocA